MSLERIQALLNRQDSNDYNVSGSNAPAQKLADAQRLAITTEAERKELIDKANSLIAQGYTPGQLRSGFAQYNRKNPDSTKLDYVRHIQQKQNIITTEVGAPEIQGVGYADLPDVDPFGQDQGQYYEYKPDDRQYDEQSLGRKSEELLEMEDRTDPEPGIPDGRRRYDRYGDVILKTGVSPIDYDKLAAEIKEFADNDQISYRNAPTSAVADALARLKGANLPKEGGVADLEDRLEDAISQPNQRKAEKALAEQLNNRDLARMSSRRAAYNNIKAQIEAEDIGETMYRRSARFPGATLPAMSADAALARIGRSNQSFPEAAFTPGGVALDPATGNPIAVQGPTLPEALLGSNTPNNAGTANALNIPQTARTWVQQTRPDLVEGGRTMGNYPQVDITLETTQFANKLRDLGRDVNLPYLSGITPGSNIRSIDELQTIANRTNRYLLENPEQKPLFIRNPDTESRVKNIPAGNQVISGLMNRLRMTSGEEERLANALYQLDAARRSSVNQNPTGTYLNRQPSARKTDDVTFQAAEMFGSSDTRIAQQPQGTSIRVGTSPEGKPVKQDIRSAMRGLSDPDAARPYIGMTAEQQERNKKGDNRTSSFRQDPVFNKTGETEPDRIAEAITRQAQKRGNFNEARNTNNVIAAQAVQRRTDAAEKKRAERIEGLIERFPYMQRAPYNIRRRP